MAIEKTTKRKKELKDLRREVEILKAQLRVTTPEIKRGAVPISAKPSKPSRNPSQDDHLDILDVNDSYVKKDLFKTLVISLLAFSTIFTIWYFR